METNRFLEMEQDRQYYITAMCNMFLIIKKIRIKSFVLKGMDILLKRDILQTVEIIKSLMIISRIYMNGRSMQVIYQTDFWG